MVLPLLLAFIGVSAAAPPLASVALVMPAAGDAVLQLTVDDPQLPTAAGLDILVDGEVRTTVLVFGKIRHPPYGALLNGLSAGRHTVAVQPSPFWPWPATAAPPTLSAFAAPDSVIIRHAPVLWLRSDTIGSATDLPLMMYAEDLRLNGTGVLRYSIIFSNEDGGTATAALLARWGRTTDIEMAYEEDWRDGQVVASRYQGPDHHTPDYTGTRDAAHPPLVVATLNNVFLDRGRTAVRVAMVPTLIDLESATRESVMDRQPWIYRRMADELREERKAAVVGDIREYLFVDARLTLTDGAVAAVARSEDGIWRSSDRGLKELTVDRAGWVRIAIPRSRSATELGVVCLPTKPSLGRCQVEIGKVFALEEDFTPGPARGTAALDIQSGEMRTMPLIRK
ncbi:MAG: hypothetical protein ABI818_17175 [Acidobacteriota bacterium]